MRQGTSPAAMVTEEMQSGNDGRGGFGHAFWQGKRRARFPRARSRSRTSATTSMIGDSPNSTHVGFWRISIDDQLLRRRVEQERSPAFRESLERAHTGFEGLERVEF